MKKKYTTKLQSGRDCKAAIKPTNVMMKKQKKINKKTINENKVYTIMGCFKIVKWLIK
jgi:hypothetical protein